MLMIRFQRIGRKNDPAFRIAVLEKTSGPKAGKYVELVGTYNPKTKDTNIQSDRIQDWVKKGAQISPSVKNLLIKEGIMEGTKTAVVSKKNLEKNKAKNEEAATAAKAAGEAANAPAPEPVVEATPEAEIKTPVETEAAPEVVEEAPVAVEEVAAEPVAEEEVAAEAA
jgi:small subunit ribosomal protein S16